MYRECAFAHGGVSQYAALSCVPVHLLHPLTLNTGLVSRIGIPMNVVSSDSSQSVIAHLVLSRVSCMCTVRVPVRF